MIRNTKLVFVLGCVVLPAASVFLGACAHTSSRKLSTDGSETKTYSANFTVVRDPELPRLVRVFHGSLASPITRVDITNPSGKVACQSGAPSRLDKTPSLSPKYSIDTYADQDIYCYLGPAPDAPASAAIRVDYAYWRPAAAVPSSNAPGDPMQRTLRDLESNHITPETLSQLESHGLLASFTLTPGTPGNKAARSGEQPSAADKIATGDFLLIHSIHTPPGKARDLSELTCTIQETPGSKPKVIFRGGDDYLATRAVKGNLDCQSARKDGGKTATAFAVRASVVHYDDAIREFGGLTRSGDQGAAARDQQSEDQTFAQVRGAVDEWLAADITVVQAFNRLIDSRRGHQADVAAQERERVRTEPFFASALWLKYRPGAYSWKFTPTKRTLPSQTGSSSFVDFEIREPKVTYYGDEKNAPSFMDWENPFRPLEAIRSDESWERANHTAWDAIVCPDKLPEFSDVLRALAADNVRGTLTPRQTVMDALAPVMASSASSCGKGLEQTLYFERQPRFSFVYSKIISPVQDGKKTRQMVVYMPDRIEASYLAPNGARIARSFVRSQNNRLSGAERHAFFEKGRPTGISADKATNLRAEIVIETQTLFPAIGADGVLTTFPKL